ncbi:MAG TPA: HD domain-containing protein [Polyangiaceae bacterium]|nr:HD domain-containing protein [Polyangiaceae bacterium]
MILRDPVHGLVAFEAAEQQIVVSLMQARELQRLRRIRQLGLTSLSYPGADHTRFSHSVGTAHVMTRFLLRLRDLERDLPEWQRITYERGVEALAAALLHDLGHGPFSHLFEQAWPDGPSHEEWTSRILLDPDTDVHQLLSRQSASLPERVAALVHGQHEITYLANIVSGTFDVDRCDYLLRDAHFTGVGYGRFDLEWLLRSLRLGTASASQAPALAIDGPKGLPAIESFILSRLFMFQQVYFHKASRASEWMLTRLLARVKQLILDGRVPVNTPVALEHLAKTNDCPLHEYLELDDTLIWQAVRAYRDDQDALLSDLSRRLFERRLYKTYELFGEQLATEWRAEALDKVRALARRAGYDPDFSVGLDVATDVPFEGSQAALSVLFPNGHHREPGEVSLLLRRLSDEAIERVRLIFPSELRSQVTACLEN